MRLSTVLLVASVVLSSPLEIWAHPHAGDRAIEARASKTTRPASSKTTRPASSSSSKGLAKGSASASKSKSKGSASASGSSRSIPIPSLNPSTKPSEINKPPSVSQSRSLDPKATPKPDEKSCKREARSVRFQARAPAAFQAKKLDGTQATFTPGGQLGQPGKYGTVYTLTGEYCYYVAKQLHRDATTETQNEIHNLNNIRELYAYSGSGTKKGDWIVMLRHDGMQLDQTTAYINAISSGNEQTIDAFRKQAARLIAKAAASYITKYKMFHYDLNPGNVVFDELNGQLTDAKIFDWGKAYMVQSSSEASQRETDWYNAWYDYFKENIKGPSRPPGF